MHAGHTKKVSLFHRFLEAWEGKLKLTSLVKVSEFSTVVDFLKYHLHILLYFFRLLKIQKKIFIVISALSYFTCREWKFQNEKFLRLLTYVLPEDKDEFDFDYSDIDPSTYFRQCILGARIYLLNDPVENMPAGKKRAVRYMLLNFLESFLTFFMNSRIKLIL